MRRLQIRTFFHPADGKELLGLSARALQADPSRRARVEIPKVRWVVGGRLMDIRSHSLFSLSLSGAQKQLFAPSTSSARLESQKPNCLTKVAELEPPRGEVTISS